MYKTVVVGTDGSDTAKIAVREAIRLTDRDGGQVHIVSSFEPVRGATIKGAPEGAAKVWAPQPDSLVQGVVEQAAASARMAGVQVETYTSTDAPADAVLEVAKEQNADLIVVGSRGMHGARRFVLGSVPNKVSHNAPCSVLIVATDKAE